MQSRLGHLTVAGVAATTLLSVVGVIVLLLSAAPLRARQAHVPTLFVIPTVTSTLPGPTANPTWTSSPAPLDVPLIAPSSTPLILLTPTAPPVLPSHIAPPTTTVTPTSTPTPTLIPTATLTPIPPTETGTAAPSLTPAPTSTSIPPTATPTNTPTPAPTPVLDARCDPGPGAAAACAGVVTIRTVEYEQALETSAGFPYPHVDFDRLGGIRPVTYPTIILENDALRLTFLPALGGRLYQITDKASGQNVLYNNPVITPTHWGPPGMRWWLAIGGVEWAFPVEEHGYAWGLPWDAAAATHADGSASVTLSFSEQVTALDVRVVVTLPASGRAFTVNTVLRNTGASSTSIQFWHNAALLAGSGMRAEWPASAIEVHGAGPHEGVYTGQTLGWNANMSEWGVWREWFSGFARSVSSGSLRMRGAGTPVGLHRSFDPAQMPGIKFFTFGPYSTVPNEYNGLPVFEVWGGLTPDFDTLQPFAPAEQRFWSETWQVVDW